MFSAWCGKTDASNLDNSINTHTILRNLHGFFSNVSSWRYTRFSYQVSSKSITEWGNPFFVCFLAKITGSWKFCEKTQQEMESNPSPFFFLLFWLQFVTFLCNSFVVFVCLFLLVWGGSFFFLNIKWYSSGISFFFNSVYLLPLFSYSVSWPYLLAVFLITVKSLHHAHSSFLSFWPVYTTVNITPTFECLSVPLDTEYTKVKSSIHSQACTSLFLSPRDGVNRSPCLPKMLPMDPCPCIIHIKFCLYPQKWPS